MLTSIIAAALLAVASAAPGKQKQQQRDIDVVFETVTDVVYVTDIVTVIASDTPYEASVTPVTPISISSSIANDTPTPSPINHDADGPFNSISPTAISIAIPSTTLGYTVMSSPTSIAAESIIVSPIPTSSSISVETSATYLPTTSVLPPLSTSSSILPPPSTPTSVATSSTSSPVMISGIAVPTDYASTVVAHHNLHRRNHSAVDIEWDGPLADTANLIASNCVYAHNTSANKDTIGGYGQNIAAGIASDNVSVIITNLFYNGEVNWYNGLYGQAQPNMINFDFWGHFSQIVWNATTKVGCATVYCSKGLANVAANVPPYMTVCNYQSPGNIAGEYTDVGYSLGLPTVEWNYFD